MLGRTIEAPDAEQAMRRSILASLEERCRGLTLRDASRWYSEAFGAASPQAEDRLP